MCLNRKILSTRVIKFFASRLLVISGVLLLQVGAFAQLSGDLRNVTLNIGEGLQGDVSTNVQTDEKGNPQATGGISVESGEKVSFNYRGSLKTQTSGFWKGEEGKTYKVLFRDQNGDKFAIIELNELVRWNKTRNVMEGEQNFLKIATIDDPNNFLEIRNRGTTDGRLVISAEGGSSFFVYDLSPDFTGTISTARVSGSFQGVSFWATNGGRKFVASGGSGILKNEKDEIVGEGQLSHTGGFLAIKGKTSATFVHIPGAETISEKSYPKKTPKDFARLELIDSGRWVLKDSNFLFLLDVEKLNVPKLKIGVDKSLARASIIKLPKGIFALWGYTVTAGKGGGTVQFQHGKIINRTNCDVKLNKTSDEKPPFAIRKQQAIGKLPFGGRLFIANCKEGHEFLIVATTEIAKGLKIHSYEMDCVLIDDTGAEYQPIAFGLPSKHSKEPFLIEGFSFKGDIENVDTKRTILALFFLIPKQAKTFSLKKPDGKMEKLTLLKDYSPPDSIRILGYKNYGRVEFGTPTIEQHGWGLK